MTIPTFRVPRGFSTSFKFLTPQWISVKDKKPPTDEPVVYAYQKSSTQWNVGIAYWTVSEKWNPECESSQAPTGFTHWIPLPSPPK